MNTTNQNLNGDGHTPEEIAAAKLTALALNQLPAEELAALERGVDANQREIREIESLSRAILAARAGEPSIATWPELKTIIGKQLEDKSMPAPSKKQRRRWPVVEAMVAGGVALVLLALLMPASQFTRWQSATSLHVDRADNEVTDLQMAVTPRIIVQEGEESKLGIEVPESGNEFIAQPNATSPQSSGQPGSINYANPNGFKHKTPVSPARKANKERPAIAAASPGGMPGGGMPPGGSGMLGGEPLSGGYGGMPETIHFGYVPGSQANTPTDEALVYRGRSARMVAEEHKASALELERLNDALLDGTLPERAAAKAQAENTSEITDAVKAVEVSKAEYEASLALRKKNLGAVSDAQLRRDQFNYEKSLAQVRQATNEKKIAGLIAQQTELDSQLIELARQRQALHGFGEQTQRLKAVNEQLAAANAAKARIDVQIEFTNKAIEYERKRINSLNYERTGEQYAPIYENSFLSPLQQPLSTFSIDVDTASYANTRRFLTTGRLPPPDAVRIEELVNYFRYDYPQPKDDKPFSVNMETAECPWREGHLLLRVGLKGKDVERAKRPVSNLVFLLDVSGSMSDANKLPLLKTAMKMLVGELGENDRVSIVTYAGDAGLKLPSARGHEQQKINAAIDSLQSGGSTNGSAGIELAYEQATAHFIEGGTNRVILCTDGDLNVGVTSDQALVELIKRKAASHVFLTVLGFGEGNLKDAKMERLADNGNGLYAYIDSVREARKVLVEQLTGSTITIAKDVKIQIEFNPAQIAAYRLLGYENRVMAAQDFNNDKKDAGEIGAGHTVTALYELVPVGAVAAKADQSQPGVDALKYQQPAVDPFADSRPSTPASGGREPTEVAQAGELLTLKLRYKQPEGETSQLLEYPLKDRGHSFNSASPDFQFAAAVASFGMVLRNSQHRGSSNLAAVAEIATGAIGADAGGYRAEFVDLVRKAQGLGAR